MPEISLEQAIDHLAQTTGASVQIHRLSQPPSRTRAWRVTLVGGRLAYDTPSLVKSFQGASLTELVTWATDWAKTARIAIDAEDTL